MRKLDLITTIFISAAVMSISYLTANTIWLALLTGFLVGYPSYNNIKDNSIPYIDGVTETEPWVENL